MCAILGTAWDEIGEWRNSGTDADCAWLGKNASPAGSGFVAAMKDAGENEHLSALMRAAQGGDQVAYSTLLALLIPILQRAVRRYRSYLQPQDVEEIVQETLISMHQIRATYDPDRPFLPWLLAIARHRMMDSARRYVRRAANEEAVGMLTETFPGAEANSEQESYRDPEELRQAIGRLPAGQRRAVELLKLEELSLKEASARTGLSISALKVAVHRGMKALTVALRKRS